MAENCNSMYEKLFENEYLHIICNCFNYKFINCLWQTRERLATADQPYAFYSLPILTRSEVYQITTSEFITYLQFTYNFSNGLYIMHRYQKYNCIKNIMNNGSYNVLCILIHKLFRYSFHRTDFHWYVFLLWYKRPLSSLGVLTKSGFVTLLAPLPTFSFQSNMNRFVLRV